MPIMVERAADGATCGMAVKIDAGTSPPILENATVARYCSDQEYRGENTTSSAAAMPMMPVQINHRGVAPRVNSQPALRLPSALASTASAVSAPASLAELPRSCRMVGKKPSTDRNWKV